MVHLYATLSIIDYDFIILSCDFTLTVNKYEGGPKNSGNG